MKDILLVEDDQTMVDLLTQHLTSDGHSLRVATSLQSTLASVAQRVPDLVLLDITLGAEDGRDVFRELRLLSDVPTIFLTGRGLASDRVAGLRMGADDYIVKPFSLDELSARIETVLRRSSPIGRASATRHYGALAIDEQSHEIHLHDTLVDLTAKEFSLLAFLAASPRQVFSREQLLEHVWGSSGEWQTEATVTEHIRRIRLKIETDPDHPNYITTVRGFGYRFNPSAD